MSSAHRQLFFAVAWPALSLSAAGCSDGGKAGPIDVPPDTTSLPAEPNPLAVRVTLDESRAVSVRIPADTGGTVRAGGADGTRFTLAIPPGALLDDADITLTPVTAVDGIPFRSGLVGAVQLEPEGLRLFAGATLTVESNKSFAVGELTGFGYHESGEEFHLKRSAVSGSRFSLEVWHFSGAGGAKGTDAERAAQQRNVPSSAEDQAEQGELVSLISTRFVDSWYQSKLRPKLIAAETDLNVLEAAAGEYAAWRRFVRQLTFPSAFEAEARSSLIKAVTNAAQKSLRRCVDNKDPYEVAEMQRLFRLARNVELPVEASLLEIDVEKCARFDLVFDSEFHNVVRSGSASEDATYHVRATVPLTLDAATGILTGRGPLEYVRFAGASTIPSVNGDIVCPATGIRAAGSVFTVRSATLNIGINANPASEITLTIDPGMPREFWRIDCIAGPIETEEAQWQFFWGMGHRYEQLDPETPDVREGPWIIREWKRAPTNGERFAQKLYTTPAAGCCYTSEVTVIELRHKPIP